jgi:hypothetical protein
MRGDAVEEIPIADPPSVHQPLIQTIVDEMNGVGHCPSSGETAARTARVIEDCLAEFKCRAQADNPRRVSRVFSSRQEWR